MKHHIMIVPAFVITLLFSTFANADCARIAYSRTTGDYGTSSEVTFFTSCSSDSEDKAISSCGKSDCVIELTVAKSDGCGSIARKVDDTNFIVTGVANSRSDAGNKAMAACGSNCKLVTTVCVE